ncbi:MAG: lgt, partial [Thermoleophilia bacterium]|nr:lgt [Thermoleophilia bacterium]
APAILLAQAIGRLGNYLNQELFGRPFDGPWALRVDRAFRPEGYADHATFHPTFLYEAIGTLLLSALFAVLLVRWRSRTPGILLPLYVAAYSVVRIAVEPVRIDEAHHWFGVRQNVWVAGFLIVAGLVVAFAMRRRDPSTRRASTA